MFNNKVTHTYTQQDATFEIILMLLGAFLLGFILNWLLNKLRNSQDNSNENVSQRNHQGDASTSQSNRSSKAKVISTQSNSSYTTPHMDDLTKISGINTEVQDALKEEGIKSYTDLRDAKRHTLEQVLKSSPSKSFNKKEVETWPHQSSLAAKSEWKKLSEYQAFIKRSQDVSKDADRSSPEASDDLILIEGIGPKIKEVLNKKDIHTFKDVRKTDSLTLKKHIVDADNRFANHETESWPHQAGMAEQNQWEELRIYQEFMVADNIESDAISDATLESSSKKVEDTNYLKDHDDLKNIEGIGPKIEEVLNAGGIYTYSQLYNSSRDRIKTLLDNAGTQFSMHEPHSWPHQAGMAHRGEWNELKVYQNFMDGGREIPSAQASEDLDSTLTNNDVKNDLKKIEGIGPKIEELLNKSGISSFKNLRDSSVTVIQKILNDAGPQYRLHEPESWPKQAGMAFEGEWEKLDQYQEQLVNDRQ
ncbi:MAG: helix-hairpin-helix domain-containing protein [Cocleimonas sp.]